MQKPPSSYMNEANGKRFLALPAPSLQMRTSQPTLHSAVLRVILDELRRDLGSLRADNATGDEIGSGELELLIQNISARHGLQLSLIERDEVMAVIEREQQPFGILQHLVDNVAVTDIIISSFDKISVQQGRNNIPTDITFPGDHAYEAFVERLLTKAGTTYSTKKPIADGMIGSFARIHAVHRSLCDRGPYVTIRLNRFPTVSLTDLVTHGLAPKPVFDYLTALVQGGCTLLIAGEVGTGKTTLARALAGAISERESILVIEDTPEIRLNHPHVRSITTREANSDGAGRITPAECIRAGMRMAMSRIIFGEIRDAEASEAFIDVCASGHPGLSTIHARSAMEAAARLQLFLGRAQRGVEARILNEQIATAVQVIVQTGICPVTGKRRILEVKEIGPVADGSLRQRDIFRYQLARTAPVWRVVNRVSAHQELLEADNDSNAYLPKLPALLELDLQVMYKEAAAL